ncbi:MAG: hypothetical protein ISP88_08170 [Pseudomonadales bacterium]|nr:hypothetical protein [Pseudomonadales bacterium]
MRQLLLFEQVDPAGNLIFVHAHFCGNCQKFFAVSGVICTTRFIPQADTNDIRDFLAAIACDSSALWHSFLALFSSDIFVLSSSNSRYSQHFQSSQPHRYQSWIQNSLCRTFLQFSIITVGFHAVAVREIGKK